MHHEAHGLFATHLFDGEPLGLGQTDDKAPIPYAPPVTGAGGKTGTTAPAPSGGKTPASLSLPGFSPGYTPPGYTPPGAPAYDSSMYATTQSSFSWTPVLMIGGGTLLAIGAFALVFGGKKKAAPTPNRRGRKRRRVRRNVGYVASGARVHGSRGLGTVAEVHGENASVRWDSGGTRWVKRSSLNRA